MPQHPYRTVKAERDNQSFHLNVTRFRNDDFPSLRAINVASRSSRWRTVIPVDQRIISHLFPARVKLNAPRVFKYSPEIKGVSRRHATEGRTLRNVFQRTFLPPFSLFPLFFFPPPLLLRAKRNNETTCRASICTGLMNDTWRTFRRIRPGSAVGFPFVTRRFVNGVFREFRQPNNETVERGGMYCEHSRASFRNERNTARERVREPASSVDCFIATFIRIDRNF